MDMRQPGRILVSAGEASGDLYASELVKSLRQQWPKTEWFGCAGPRLREAGVEAIVESESLAVVGLVEVISHLPRIYGLYRKLVATAARRKPDLAILTDSPDFHLRVAKQMKRQGVPVVYLVAPQAWAWRQGRVKGMRETIERLLCLFPFEETWYRQRGVKAHYIGHPLARLARARQTRSEFFDTHKLDSDQPLIALCPGSRVGELRRHLPVVARAATLIAQRRPATFVLATPSGLARRVGEDFFKERISGLSIQRIEGETWDVLAHADVVLAASGTVTIEAALLGTPMVTYYKVTGASWLMGRVLVKSPFYSMVNLIAERRIVPELMQNEFTAENLAREALQLLENKELGDRMRRDLLEVRQKLQIEADPMENAARLVRELYA